jgi:hypothetical protein
MTVRKIALKYALLLAAIAIAVMISSYGNSEETEKKKKLYISSIKAENLSKSIANRVREGLSLAIFGNYGKQYHVLDDDAIRVMYRQAEKILASGCTDYSCMTQIANRPEHRRRETSRRGAQRLFRCYIKRRASPQKMANTRTYEPD